jgi:hypothetical protein
VLGKIPTGALNFSVAPFLAAKKDKVFETFHHISLLVTAGGCSDYTFTLGNHSSMSDDIMDRFWSAPPVSRYAYSLFWGYPISSFNLFKGGS